MIFVDSVLRDKQSRKLIQTQLSETYHNLEKQYRSIHTCERSYEYDINTFTWIIVCYNSMDDWVQNIEGMLGVRYTSPQIFSESAHEAFGAKLTTHKNRTIFIVCHWNLIVDLFFKLLWSAHHTINLLSIIFDFSSISQLIMHTIESLQWR